MQLPDKFCEEMKRMLGDEYPAYLASLGEERKYGLRVNTAKISVEEFEEIAPFPVRKIPFVENGFYYDSQVQPAKHPYYFAGLYYLQEPSAMTPASRLPVKEGDRVLDLCAAPGGKATELAARLRGTGLLVANDISAKRAKALLKNIELFGVGNSFVVTEYPQKLQEFFTGFFDAILIDAPCSGEGMFRKDASMVKAWERNGPEFYAALQEDIVGQALPLLRPGGMLLYSTCTFSPLEDEGTVLKILDMDKTMELVPMEGYEGFAEGMPELVGSGNTSLRRCVRIFPHRMGGEGHFLALFRKRGESAGPVSASEGCGESAGPVSASEGCGEGAGPETASRKRGRRPPGLRGEEKRLFGEFAENLNRKFEPGRIEGRQGMLYYMPEEFPPLRGLRFLRSGLFLGECKYSKQRAPHSAGRTEVPKGRFEPSQSLAMALKSGDYKNCLMLTAEDERVERYLKGETLFLTEEEGRVVGGGWVLVCVDGYPLGWGKRSAAAGGAAPSPVLKNKYHSGWRLM